MTKYSHLNFAVPLQNAGQIIEIAYAIDSEREEVVCRSHDSSDDTESFAVTPLANLVGGFEPWNKRPEFADAGLWETVS